MILDAWPQQTVFIAAATTVTPILHDSAGTVVATTPDDRYALALATAVAFIISLPVSIAVLYHGVFVAEGAKGVGTRFPLYLALIEILITIVAIIDPVLAISGMPPATDDACAAIGAVRNLFTVYHLVIEILVAYAIYQRTVRLQKVDFGAHDYKLLVGAFVTSLVFILALIPLQAYGPSRYSICMFSITSPYRVPLGIMFAVTHTLMYIGLMWLYIASWCRISSAMADATEESKRIEMTTLTAKNCQTRTGDSSVVLVAAAAGNAYPSLSPNGDQGLALCTTADARLQLGTVVRILRFVVASALIWIPSSVGVVLLQFKADTLASTIVAGVTFGLSGALIGAVYFWNTYEVQRERRRATL